MCHLILDVNFMVPNAKVAVMTIFHSITDSHILTLPVVLDVQICLLVWCKNIACVGLLKILGYKVWSHWNESAENLMTRSFAVCTSRIVSCKFQLSDCQLIQGTVCTGVRMWCSSEIHFSNILTIITLTLWTSPYLLFNDDAKCNDTIKSTEMSIK